VIDLVESALLKKILTKSRNIAIVGLSPKENRPSYQVAVYLQEAGYTIIPVNPGHESILGESCYPDLQTIPAKVDVVNIFRRSDHVVPIVQDAVKIGAAVIWMQLGIVNTHAAEIAEQAGMTVVMNRCIKIDHTLFFGIEPDQSI